MNNIQKFLSIYNTNDTFEASDIYCNRNKKLYKKNIISKKKIITIASILLLIINLIIVLFTKNVVIINNNIHIFMNTKTNNIKIINNQNDIFNNYTKNLISNLLNNTFDGFQIKRLFFNHFFIKYIQKHHNKTKFKNDILFFNLISVNFIEFLKQKIFKINKKHFFKPLTKIHKTFEIIYSENINIFLEPLFNASLKFFFQDINNIFLLNLQIDHLISAWKIFIKKIFKNKKEYLQKVFQQIKSKNNNLKNVFLIKLINNSNKYIIIKFNIIDKELKNNKKFINNNDKLKLLNNLYTYLKYFKFQSYNFNYNQLEKYLFYDTLLNLKQTKIYLPILNNKKISFIFKNETIKLLLPTWEKQKITIHNNENFNITMYKKYKHIIILNHNTNNKEFNNLFQYIKTNNPQIIKSNKTFFIPNYFTIYNNDTNKIQQKIYQMFKIYFLLFQLIKNIQNKKYYKELINIENIILNQYDDRNIISNDLGINNIYKKLKYEFQILFSEFMKFRQKENITKKIPINIFCDLENFISKPDIFVFLQQKSLIFTKIFKFNFINKNKTLNKGINFFLINMNENNINNINKILNKNNHIINNNLFIKLFKDITNIIKIYRNNNNFSTLESIKINYNNSIIELNKEILTQNIYYNFQIPKKIFISNIDLNIKNILQQSLI